jgi:hypothetical protein
MHQKCLKNNDYASKATPWNESRLNPLPQSVRVDMTEEARQTIAERLAMPEIPEFSLQRSATKFVRE